MTALANLSIRSKLLGIVIISTVLSAGGGFGLVVTRAITAFKADLVNNTETIAKVTRREAGINTEFDLEADARELLSDLTDLPWISDACLFKLDEEKIKEELYLCAREDAIVPDRIPAVADMSSFRAFSEGYVSTFVHLDYPDSDSGKMIDVGTLYLRATTEIYNQKVKQDIFYMATVMLAVIAVALLVAYLLQGFISKPILYLAEMAQRVSKKADYSVRVPKPGNDEIGILYDGFNDMLEQIQNRQEDLERSNRDLDQFAYVASHDLKAPLRAIATLSGWIEEDLEGNLSEEASEQMTLLRSRVQRMDRLIEGILQYSRAGRTDSHGEKVDLGDMLDELVELLSPPKSFQVVIAKPMPTITTRRLRLEQVLSNLINNAFKYHDREDGKVEIAARRQGRFFEFSVSDDGPGIAEEHHEKVFMMFQTLHPRDQFESTGLGLSLVKKIVEEEGGAIHLDSKEGHGATFRFTWPVMEASEPSEETLS